MAKRKRRKTARGNGNDGNMYAGYRPSDAAAVMNGVNPFAAPASGLRGRLEQRMQILDGFQFAEYMPVPSELGLPEGARMAVKSTRDGIKMMFPYMVTIEMADGVYKQEAWRAAKEGIIAERSKRDYVELRYEDLRWIGRLMSRKSAELPVPFCNEPLEGFTVKLKSANNDTIDIDFAPSRMPVLAEDDDVTKFIPKVDYLVNSGEKMVGSLGIVMVVDGIYAVGICSEGAYQEKGMAALAKLVWCYFVAQYACYVCPERVVEVNPGGAVSKLGEALLSGECSEERKRKPRELGTVKLQRVIRIGGPAGASNPSEPGRQFERRTECWYSRGGKRRKPHSDEMIYFKGSYKGPKRNDPEARRRVKRYKVDEDMNRDGDEMVKS